VARLLAVNTLSFRRMRGTYDPELVPHELDIAVPVVDGVPLHELMGDRFFGIATSLVTPPSQHLLGSPTYVEDGLTVLLDGDCLAAACCGVMARVAVGNRTVRWTDFFARGLPEPPAGVAFEFDRAQYESALATLDAVDVESFPADVS
jgi:hypothetical protein